MWMKNFKHEGRETATWVCGWLTFFPQSSFSPMMTVSVPILDKSSYSPG